MDKVFYSRLKDEIKFPNKIFSNVIPKAIRKKIVNYFENHIWELTRDVNKSKVSKGVSFTLPCPSIFRNSIQEFILPHFLDFPIQNFKLHLSDPCVLYIVEPTMPHVDGHLVYGKEGGYLIKTILIPLCIIKNNNINFSFDNVIFTLFQQHLNYTASLGGLEFNKTFLRKKQIQEFKQTQFYERFIGKHYFNKAGIEDLPIEDNNGNTLLLNLHNSWITKQNVVFFRKMVDAYTNFREEASKVLPNLDLVLFNCLHGLTIENIYNFKDGEFLVQNPYQTHCSGDFKDFDAKLCLRLNLYINKK